MQAPSWSEFLHCSVCTNRYDTATLLPISLSCGHTICRNCLTKFMARVCPYDKTAISPNAELLPPNSALLWLLGKEEEAEEEVDYSQLSLGPEDLKLFMSARASIKNAALFLQPLSEQGASTTINFLTRPMLKKLVTVVNCQFLESDGRARVLRAARSITDRTVTELLVMHQNQQQISTLLWTAIRSRGCQFLGPVMQEEALKLILKVLEGGAFLSRKNIVLYVVQQLQHEFNQASKTCVGHVVQLLYRASCFNVEKRDEDSSRMQLKEEFRTYEALRREHDAQIIRVAMEAGLRISPEQWSALLYGDQKHKSDMQSIIDKLLSQGVATSGLSELIVAIRRSQDPHNLLEKIVPHLETLLKIDINIDKSSALVDQWQFFADAMAALVAMMQEYSSFMQIQSGRYKTGMCPNLSKPGGCPKGDLCTYAHSEEEREKYRQLARGAKAKSRSESGKPLSGPQPSVPPRGGGGRYSGELGTAKLDSSPFSSMGYDGQSFSSGSSGFAVGETYSEYSTYPTVGNSAPIVIQSSLPVVGQRAALTSDPNLSAHVIPGQPQLVNYQSPHHSGPVAVGGDPMAVYNAPAAMEGYYTTRRSDSIPEEYDVYSHGQLMGMSGDGQSYIATPTLPTGDYLPSSAPSALNSIKRMHEHVKKSIQPQDERSQFNYPSTDHPSPENDPRQPPMVTPPDVAPDIHSRHPTPEEWKYHEGAPVYRHEGEGGGHTNSSPPESGYHPAGVGVYPGAGDGNDGEEGGGGGEEVRWNRSGEEEWRRDDGGGGEGGGGGGGGKEGREDGGSRKELVGGAYDQDLPNQISRMRLMEPSHYSSSAYTPASTAAAGFVSQSHSQLPMPRSSSYSMAMPGHIPQERGYRRASEDVPTRQSGEVDEMAAMKEKIRQLETQLAEEKMKQYSGPQPQQPSPVHTGQLYQDARPSRYSGPVQPVQYSSSPVQVHMFQTAPVQPQHAYYAQATPPTAYPYNWSGPQSGHYSGELASLQATSPGTGLVMQQTGGRQFYVQQAQPQDMMSKDHMLAMYLQALEQNKAQPHFTHAPSPFPPGGSTMHPQYGGGAPLTTLGYRSSNQYVAPSGQYMMKPYQY